MRKGPIPTEIEGNEQEQQYLDLILKVLLEGDERTDRTKVGTSSIFGSVLRFDLSKGFPLLTTKKINFSNIVKELLGFIHGKTSSEELGARIWGKNGSRTFLDSRGLKDYKTGDLGPLYGFQWRHWGESYTGSQTSYEGKGIDQLQRMVNMIKTNPTSRRILVSAWNVSDLPKMALPPCHIMFQAYVTGKKLSLSVYMRSVDVGLGMPYNIASYSLLLHLLCIVTDKEPGELVMMTGDTHIYKTHYDALKKQWARKPRPFPTIEIKRREKLEDFKSEDISLIGYKPHGFIKMEMAV